MDLLPLRERMGSEAPTAENGDDLSLYLFQGNRAEIPAVFGLGAVVAQKEQMVFRNQIGIGQAFLGVSGIQDLSCLMGSVHKQLPAVVQYYGVRCSCNDPPNMGFAVHCVNDHIILGIFLLNPKGNYQIAILNSGEHGVSADLGNQEHLGKHNPACKRQKQHTQQQAPIALGIQGPVAAGGDDGGIG